LKSDKVRLAIAGFTARRPHSYAQPIRLSIGETKGFLVPGCLTRLRPTPSRPRSSPCPGSCGRGTPAWCRRFSVEPLPWFSASAIVCMLLRHLVTI